MFILPYNYGGIQSVFLINNNGKIFLDY